ncbi:MAG: PilZ domain-containing protein, partial [Myxococcota bacterium]
MHAPEVLLLDDGELDDVATLLEDMQAPCQRLCGGEMLREIPTPRQLLVATPRRLATLADPSGLQGIPRRVVVSEGDSVGMRAQLRLTGFDYLVRRPVHPEALRLLLLRCLYEGDEQRQDTRVVVGSPVSYRSGLLTRPATLIDLSVGGCRLLAQKQIPPGRRVRIQLPEYDPKNTAVTLMGRVVRADEDRFPGSSLGWRLGIAFEALDEA